MTGQGLVLPGCVGGVPGALLSPRDRRLQGTQGALHTHLQMSGAGSRQGTESTQPAPGLPPKSRLEKTLYRGKGENEEKRLFRGVGAGVLTVAASRSAAAGGVARSEQGRDRVFTVGVIALHIFAANTFVVNIFTALLTGQP